MKSFIVFLALLVIAVSGTTASPLDTADWDDTAVAIHDVHKRDIFDAVRATLNGLVNSLNNAANDFNNGLVQFLNTSKIWREDILGQVQNTTNQWLNDVESAVNQVLNSTTSIIGSVADCLTGQQSNAVELVNGTINGVLTCVDSVVNEVTNAIADGVDLSLTAVSLAITLSAEIINCGVANILNFPQVGICLNSLVQKYTNNVNSLVGKIVGFTSQLAYNVVIVPTSFTTCMGSTVAIAVFQIINIVQQVPMCIAGNVG